MIIKKLTFSLISMLIAGSTYTQTFQVDKNYEIGYQVINDKLQITFILKNNYNGWMGVGFNEFMFPADTIIAWWDKQTNQPIVWDSYNPGIPTLPSFPAPLQDNNPYMIIEGGSPLDNKQNVTIVSASNKDGVITIKTERKLVTGDIFDLQFELGRSYNIVAAYNKSQGFTNEFNANQPMHTSVGGGRWTLPANTTLEDTP
jgi:hypothetical protein